MKRPIITISYAQSLDGRLATATGESQWIGGPESLQFCQELRRDHQSILVGINTVLKDNPRLTCRLQGARNPIRIILDGHYRFPMNGYLAASLAEAPVWIFGSDSLEYKEKRSALQAAGLRVFPTASEASGLDLEQVLRRLTLEGVDSLFVEGGASVITSFLKRGFYDRILVITAPFILGKGIEAVGDLGIRSLKEVPQPLWSESRILGRDTLTELVFHDR